MTAKEHLAAEVHTRLAQHHGAAAIFHNGKSKGHELRAQLFQSLQKADGQDAHKKLAEIHERDAALHAEYASHHERMAQLHKKAAELCAKAIDVVDLSKRGNELQPSPVSRVTPDIPNLRAVPRIGAAPIPKPNVPQEFEKVFSVEAEE